MVAGMHGHAEDRRTTTERIGMSRRAALAAPAHMRFVHVEQGDLRSAPRQASAGQGAHGARAERRDLEGRVASHPALLHQAPPSPRRAAAILHP